ncbi:Uncharacterised protein [Delftia tsuruhatensis]|nr:Uncharacterised protein [Delftia tsuruhatensis]
MAINKADEAYAQSGNQEIDEGLHLRLSVIKAQAYIDAGQYNQAIAILNKYLLENNYQVLKDIEATRENYRSVYHAFFSALGEATLHLGHFEESKKYIDIALNFDKNGFYAIYLKSLATFSLGDEPGSEILFNEARDRYPPSYRATLEKMRSDYKKMLCSNGELSHLKKESWHCKD